MVLINMSDAMNILCCINNLTFIMISKEDYVNGIHTNEKFIFWILKMV